MQNISQASAQDAILLDSEHMAYLKNHLGTHGASDVICKAIDELSLGLARVQNFGSIADKRAVRQNCKALKIAANLVGLKSLAQVADETFVMIETADDVALASVLERLVRVGQASLSALWEHPDLPF
ncbi:hypothetical protein [Pseudoprimorskyibacter insulae]|uniref:HPt domain-containing protein n=1 Tax=Pseudoprimorskyibacter insulae TaxID=1695997 RepID=A0A2R8AVJ6_9RHOB|nr:hypothetical protein [Pseudoprimorskyibacter insulae]SPF80051.1 hypothetical protein PRI8871_01853 [Pseudoprimorskyibacter insulae]